MLMSFPNTSVMQIITTSYKEISAVELMASSGAQGNPNSAGERRGKYPLDSEPSLHFTGEAYPLRAGFFSSPPRLFPFKPLLLSLLLCAAESDPQARRISGRLFPRAAAPHKVGWCAIQHPGSSFSSHSQWQSFVRMRRWMLWTKIGRGNLAGFGTAF